MKGLFTPQSVAFCGGAGAELKCAWNCSAALLAGDD